MFLENLNHIWSTPCTIKFSVPSGSISHLIPLVPHRKFSQLFSCQKIFFLRLMKLHCLYFLVSSFLQFHKITNFIDMEYSSIISNWLTNSRSRSSRDVGNLGSLPQTSMQSELPMDLLGVILSTHETNFSLVFHVFWFSSIVCLIILILFQLVDSTNPFPLGQ